MHDLDSDGVVNLGASVGDAGIPRPVAPSASLAAMARETRRIRLGTSIILLPLRNPIFVAEEVAMVDQLSNGRLEVGFGRGYQPYEFKRLGVDFAKATDFWSRASMRSRTSSRTPTCLSNRPCSTSQP